MNPKYLANFELQHFRYNGLKIIGNKASDSEYIVDYNPVTSASFTATKKEIIKRTNKIRPVETTVGNWDWHHIVVGQHAAMLSIKGDLESKYKHELPVVLINKNAHKFFSRNFNTDDFLELVNARKLKKELLHVEAVRLFSDIPGKEELKMESSNLKELYSNIYIDYPVLKSVALNIFTVYENEI